MCGRVLPIKGRYLSEPTLKRVGQGNVVRIEDVCRAYPWDGKANYCSWYDNKGAISPFIMSFIYCFSMRLK